MQFHLITIGMLAGGLGLFLLAVSMITDGLKMAAGSALRGMLAKWTRTPAHGILTGLSITAIVQSSSAVTVATIGFVNAGIISMYQALGIVFGSNIGTTITGWLVAIVGFKINVDAFALPMIGVGMLLKLTGNNSRRAHFGLALAGFGLFFIGIDVLKDAFEGLATAIDLQRFTLDGIAGVFMYLGIGFLMTVLTQSSSAAIAITLTAATGGILGIYAAAAMVIGANVGTTSTAAIAVIGATSNAKRVAAAHIIFNFVTGVVALLILPLLFLVVKHTGKLLGLQDIPAVTLALFHTIFNVLGVLLMWPLSQRLAHFLAKRFVTQEEIEGRPRYLDKNIAESPELAVNALALELSRIAGFARRMAKDVLSTDKNQKKRIVSDHLVVEKLAHAVAEFITKMERGALSNEVAEELKKVLRSEQHLISCAEEILEIVSVPPELRVVDDVGLMVHVASYQSEVITLIELTDLEAKAFSIIELEKQLEKVQVLYEEVKADLLHAGVELRVPISRMNDMLEQISSIRRMVRQLYKATRQLNHVYEFAGIRSQEKDSGSEEQQDEHVLPVTPQTDE
jgi:phosphate:Na+ symporter